MKTKRMAALIAIIASLSLAVTPIAASAAELTEVSSPVSADEDTAADSTDETDSEEANRMLEEMFGKIVMNDYEKRTGNTAANYTCVLPTEGNQVTVTLTDENGEVLDVYTFDGETGIGTNQNGDAIDVTEFMEEVPEEEYFVPFDRMSETAENCYEETTGVRPTGSSTMIDVDDSTKVNITLYDDDNNELETYSVDLRTGAGTDSAGNEVDLSAYSDKLSWQLEEMFGKIVMNDYEKRTGNTAADYWCVLPEEGNPVSVTLVDENGDVLDIYTFDGVTGIGTNMNGDEIDVTEFIEEVPEEEYFVPFDQMSDVAARCYEETTGVRSTGSSTMIDLDDSTKIIIELFDENENELETYTVDLRTGVGTDSAGNEVDLSAYAAAISIDESDYFVPVYVMDDAAINLYREQTGVKPVGVMVDADPKFSNAVITLFDENDNELETYTVGLTTGEGTDSNGNAVNLSDYTDEPATDESELFIPEAIMDEAAEGYYTELTGTEPTSAIVMLNLFIPEAEISLYNSEGNEIETYVINPLNGIGTDTEGNMVDLAQYAETHEITDTLPPVWDTPDESEYFAPSDDIMEYALVDYQQKTGTEANYVSFEPDEDNQTAAIEFYDEDDNVVETYTIDVKTGIGTDSAGNEVNLPQTGNNAPAALLAALGALMMTCGGAWCIRRSGILGKNQ